MTEKSVGGPDHQTSYSVKFMWLYKSLRVENSVKIINDLKNRTAAVLQEFMLKCCIEYGKKWNILWTLRMTDGAHMG
jgi:hypothetical protein